MFIKLLMKVFVFFRGRSSGAEFLPRLLSWLLSRFPSLAKLASRAIIERFTDTTTARPRPYSLQADYTTWSSLTDRTFSGRQLPPDQVARNLPSIETTAQLWRRVDDREITSKDTSVLLGYFAQWFTDSFLRTDLDDWRKNTSNHEIDLCQIYGLNAEKTDLLRLKQDGKLRYQMIDGAMYPPRLFSPDVTREALLKCKTKAQLKAVFGTADAGLSNFSQLHDLEKLKYLYKSYPDEALRHAVATGLEHGNFHVGYTAVNTVFLREHNRLCDMFLGIHKDNGMTSVELDEFIFQKVRNTMIAVLLKIVVCDYVRQIGGLNKYDFQLQIDPRVGEGKAWKRSNWVSIEFNLLYRWHSLIPNEAMVDGHSYALRAFRNNPEKLTELGMERVLGSASKQRAGQIGLQNTHEMFFQPMAFAAADVEEKSSIQERTVKMARNAKLLPYNDYREAYGLKPIQSFEALTDDVALQEKLRDLYGSMDNLEWFVGVFAEAPKSGALLGELMRTMVAYDAFTHALSNPLISPNIFNADTFTEEGFDVVSTTSTFAELFNRNANGDVKLTSAFNSEA